MADIPELQRFLELETHLSHDITANGTYFQHPCDYGARVPFDKPLRVGDKLKIRIERNVAQFQVVFTTCSPTSLAKHVSQDRCSPLVAGCDGRVFHVSM